MEEKKEGFQIKQSEKKSALTEAGVDLNRLLDGHSLPTHEKHNFTNGLVIELTQICKSKGLTQSGLIRWIHELSPNELKEDCARANEDSIGLKVNDLKKSLDKFRRNKGKDLRENLLESVFGFPEISKVKQIKEAVQDSELETKTKITTVIHNLAEENRGIKRKYNLLVNENECLAGDLVNMELTLAMKEEQYMNALEEIQKISEDFIKLTNNYNSDIDTCESVVNKMKGNLLEKQKSLEKIEHDLKDARKKISHQKTKNENRRTKRSKEKIEATELAVKQKENKLAVVQQELIYKRKK